ncbi:MAG: ABC transporter permease, partial [Trueperaceae bacterium]|nr:ABC transporter permease [Trueperaceae bacterium]
REPGGLVLGPLQALAAPLQGLMGAPGLRPRPAGLLGGAVFTETVFAWPGVGRMLVDALLARDLPLAQGSVLVVSLLFILVNLAVDLSYAAINPKVRYG